MKTKKCFGQFRFVLVLFFMCAFGSLAQAQNPYANNAFDDNMKVVDSVQISPGVYQYIFAIYSGDINQDGNIDLSDFPLWDDDNTNFAFGYRDADLNGDGNVDLSDFPFWDENNTNFIYSHKPQ